MRSEEARRLAEGHRPDCPRQIGVSVAQSIGANPEPFLMGVAVAASCAVLTPTGHKNNTIIMGPGGY